MKRKLIGLIIAIVLLGAFGMAQATLRIIGTASYNGTDYNLIWDDDNNGNSVIWLDYVNSSGMWPNQVAWAAALDAQITYNINPAYNVTWIDSTWRLPATVDGPVVDGCDGTTTAGYNITSSEMGHLYYVELANLGRDDTACVYQGGFGLNNIGHFSHLVPGDYWSSTDHADDAWGFDFFDGKQELMNGKGYSLKGLAVRSGQVGQGPLVCATDYIYYLPYFANSSTEWTGLGLANDATTAEAKICVVIFAEDGNELSISSKAIAANGQDAFVVGVGPDSKGWVKIQSSQPLSGLSFAGISSGSGHMADVPITDFLSRSLVIPHVAQSSTWDTQIFIANPNNSLSNIELTYYDKAGSTPYGTKTYSIPANGSTTIAVSALVNSNNVISGKVIITASEGVTAFALYDSLKSGGDSYAGINAAIPGK